MWPIMSLSKKDFNNLLSKANIYSEIKDDINIFISEDEQLSHNSFDTIGSTTSGKYLGFLVVLPCI